MWLIGIASGALHGAESLPLHEMAFEQLMTLELSTAARKIQPLSRTPAAAFVITRDDIRRSGADSIPEALRLAPGVDAAQISPGNWSLTIRGFSGRFANKLLVLIDGRAVYNPGFAGVYWEMLDLLLEDVERIEVVRGPGAALWGANAVNGVINIITRHSAETRGGMLGARLGDLRDSVAARRGGRLGETGTWRVYAKAEHHGDFDAVRGEALDNGLQRHQLGFRMDLQGTPRDQWTLQGNVLRLDQDQVLDVPSLNDTPALRERVDDTLDLTGAWLMGRWERALSSSSEMMLQSYLYYLDRDELLYRERLSTFDLDFQYRLAPARRHDMLWGLGYRVSDDTLDARTETFAKPRESCTQDTLSAFLQDEIQLVEARFWVTVGTKIEHNDYTGWEWQPNIRALWRPNDTNTLWASVARALRTPSRIDVNSRIEFDAFRAPGVPLPIFITAVGNSGFESESLIAWELGYRLQPRADLTVDAALFYHDYSGLRDGILDRSTIEDGLVRQTLVVDNAVDGEGYGVELAVDWRPSARWRFQLAWTHQRLDLAWASDAEEPVEWEERSINRGSPQDLLSLRSGWNARPDLDLDIWLRAVDEDPVQRVPAYVTLDARVAWRPRRGVELALVGKNLLDPAHQEYLDEGFSAPAEVPRSVTATVRYLF